jgi:hypothetical protein
MVFGIAMVVLTLFAPDGIVDLKQDCVSGRGGVSRGFGQEALHGVPTLATRTRDRPEVHTYTSIIYKY